METRKFIRGLRKEVLELRFKWGLSQENFAKALGISQATVVKLEKARYDDLPKHETLLAIANALQVDYWYLIKQLSEGCDIEGGEFSEARIVAAINNIELIETCVKIQIELGKRFEHLR